MPWAADIERRLARIGWRGAPESDGAPDGAEPARVVVQHRAGYELHDGARAFTAQPAPRFLKRGLEPSERPAVGDFVLVVPGTPAQIERVLPRRSVLARAAAGEQHRRQIIATNVDTVFVLSGLDADFNPARIERYLVLVEGSGARAVVVLTKADRCADTTARAAELRARVGAVEIVAVDAKSAASVAPLLAHLGPGDSAVLVGSSGAGKSTLTNTLFGEARQATGAVRARDGRGRHTTTHRALIMLPSGGCLIDTPGMRELKLTGDEALDRGGFADVEALAAECRFGDCTHRSEPGCAVQAALADGRLEPAHWQNYLKLRDELAAAGDSLEAQLRRRGVSAKGLGRRLGAKTGQR
ncbi:MAG TPA: ribosome small subunit-dependent GTPase A [Dokdonella sp.]